MKTKLLFPAMICFTLCGCDKTEEWRKAKIESRLAQEPFREGDLVEAVLDHRRGQVIGHPYVDWDQQQWAVRFSNTNQTINVSAAGGGVISGGSARSESSPYVIVHFKDFEIRKVEE